MFITSPEQLEGKSILNWVGVQLAFSSSEDIEQVIWSHESVPYRQFFEVELDLSDGYKAKIEAGLDPDCNYYCLSFNTSDKKLKNYVPSNGDFIRVHTLDNLPLGKIENVTAVFNELKQLVGLNISINGVSCEICCGEVTENEEKLFEIIRPQEFVLVGV